MKRSTTIPVPSSGIDHRLRTPASSGPTNSGGAITTIVSLLDSNQPGRDDSLGNDRDAAFRGARPTLASNDRSPSGRNLMRSSLGAAPLGGSPLPGLNDSPNGRGLDMSRSLDASPLNRNLEMSRSLDAPGRGLPQPRLSPQLSSRGLVGPVPSHMSPPPDPRRRSGSNSPDVDLEAVQRADDAVRARVGRIREKMGIHMPDSNAGKSSWNIPMDHISRQTAELKRSISFKHERAALTHIGKIAESVQQEESNADVETTFKNYDVKSVMERRPALREGRRRRGASGANGMNGVNGNGVMGPNGVIVANGAGGINEDFDDDFDDEEEVAPVQYRNAVGEVFVRYPNRDNSFDDDVPDGFYPVNNGSAPGTPGSGRRGSLARLDEFGGTSQYAAMRSSRSGSGSEDEFGQPGSPTAGHGKSSPHRSEEELSNELADLAAATNVSVVRFMDLSKTPQLDRNALDIFTDQFTQDSSRLITTLKQQGRASDDFARRRQAFSVAADLEIGPLKLASRVRDMFRSSGPSAEDSPEVRKVNKITKQMAEATEIADPNNYKSNAPLVLKRLDQLNYGVDRNNSKQFEEAARLLPKTAARLSKSARAEAHTTGDEQRRRKLLAAADQLDQAAPELVTEGHKTLGGGGPEQKQSVSRRIDLMRDAVNDIAGVREQETEYQITDLASNQTMSISKLVESVVGKKNKGDVEGLAETVQKDNKELLKILRRHAKKQVLEQKKRRSKRRSFAHVVAELELTPAQLIAQSRASLKADKTSEDEFNSTLLALGKAAQKAVSSADEFSFDNAAPEAIYEIDQLTHAVDRLNPQEFDRTGKHLPRAVGRLQRMARIEANMTNDSRRSQQLMTAADRLGSLTPELLETGKRNMANSTPQTRQQFNSQVETMRYTIGAITGVREQEADMQISDLAEFERDAVDRVMQSVAAGDKAGLELSVDQLTKDNNEMIGKLKSQLNATEHPGRKKQIVNTVADLEMTPAQFIAASRAALTGPSNEEYTAAMQSLGSRVKKTLASADPYDLESAAPLVIKEVDQLDQAIQRNNEADFNRVSKHFPRAVFRLAKLAKIEANQTDDEARSNALNAAADRLADASPAVVDAGRRALQGQSAAHSVDWSSQSRSLRSTVNDLVGKADVDPETQISDAAALHQSSAAQLIEAAIAGNKPAVEAAIELVKKDNAELVRLLKVQAAATDHPARKKQIMEVIAELEAAPGELIAAAQAVVANPSNADAVAELKAVGAAVSRAIAAADPNNFESAAPLALKETDTLAHAVDRFSVKELEHASKFFPRALQQLSKLARREALTIADPTRKKALALATDLIDKTVPELVDNGQRILHGGSVQLKQQFAAQLKSLKDAISTVAGVREIDPERQVADMASVEQDAITKLIAAAKAGDRSTVDSLADQIEKDNQELIHLLHAAAKATSYVPRKNQIGNLISDLELVPAQLIAAARAVMKAPTNQDALKALDSIGELAAKLVATADSDTFQSAGPLAMREADLINHAVDRHNHKEFEHSVKHFPRAVSRLAKMARREAANAADPDRRTALLAAADQLDATAPGVVQAGKRTINGGSAEMQQQWATQIKTVKDAINAIAGPCELDPELRITDLAQMETAAITKLLEAATLNDKATVDALAEQIQKDNADLVGLLRTMAKESTDNPTRQQQMMAAAADLEAMPGQLVAAARGLQRTPSNRDLSAGLASIGRQMIQAIAAVDPNSMDNAAPAAEGLLDQLKQAVERGNQKGAEISIKYLPRAVTRLAKLARKEASLTPGANRRKALIGAADRLEQMAPEVIDMGKRNLSGSSANERRQLSDHIEAMKDAINAIAGVREKDPEIQISELCRNEAEAIKRLVEAASSFDRGAFEQLAEQVQKDNDELLSLLQTAAKATDDPERRTQLFAQAADLAQMPAQLMAAARASLKNASDEAMANEMRSVGQKMVAAVLAVDPFSYDNAAPLAEEWIDQLVEAVDGQSPKEQEHIAKHFPRAVARLSKLARREANITSDPARRTMLLAAADDFDKLTPDLLETSKRAVSGANSQLKEKFQQQTKKLQDTIVSIAGQRPADPEKQVTKASRHHNASINRFLESARSAAMHGNSAALEAAVGQFEKDNAAFAAELQEMMQKTQDAERRQQLRDAIGELDMLPSQMIALARAAIKGSPDEDFYAEFANLGRKMAQAVAGVDLFSIDSAAPLTEQWLDELNEAVDRSNEKDFANIAKHFPRAVSRLAKLARRESNLTTDPDRRKALAVAADQLEKLTPELMETGKHNVVSATPQAKDKMAQQMGAVRDAIGVIDGGRSRDPEKMITKLARSQQAAIVRLQESARGGKRTAVDTIAAQLLKDNGELLNVLRAAAKATEDPLRRQQIMDTISDVEMTPAQLVAAAKAASKSPNNQELAAQLLNLRCVTSRFR
eukprot:TRINITY_DN5089_c0_g1_i5.p1 TRINITY_DN5089_c0_g1~~TRINITY_DN5089_c0_g1_i5.p1  ORF type:complete len:2428 (+),score=1073.30 TRINITY_DN5089_c0_g1_i5:51-7286(+)